MDYHSLKRKELQALCKEHNIPANSANSVLADKLSALLNEKQKPKARQRTCMKSSVETMDRVEPAESKREAKKVRFSPNNDLVEYELWSGEKQKDMVTQVKTRRKSVVKKVDKSVVDDDIADELVEDTAQISVRVTRSRVQSSIKDAVVPNNEKKKGRKGSKDVEKGTDADKGTEGNVGKVTRSKANTLQKGGAVDREDNMQSKRVVKEVEEATESVVEKVVGRVRVTRSKALTSAVEHEDNKQSKRVVKEVEEETESVDKPVVGCVRVTRSKVPTSAVEREDNKQSKRVVKEVEEETESVDKPVVGCVRVTRSKVPTSAVEREDNKQSKRVVKEAKEETESVDEPLVGRVRVTRSKAQTSMEGGTGRDANPHVKKKTGKQLKTDEQSVVPVRATRFTGQTPKGDIENTDTKTQVDKKRTRREMKATDLNSNSSHVAPVDKQETSKRKSLRTRGVDEDEGDKVEVIANSRATRSKARLAMEDSGRNNNKNKVKVEELEEPLKHAGKKNVNRRKSVLQPGKTVVDPHLEEVVFSPSRKNTRRKSVMPKATKTVESPTVGKRRSKGLSINIKEKENVTGSGKKSSEEVTTGTPKSRKRRGTPILEDQTIETEYDPLVKSPRSSTRSVNKSEAKSVAKKWVESSVKKPMSKMNKQSSDKKSSFKGKNSATRTGAIDRDTSSKKRAKFSATEQSDSEDHPVNSIKEGTPVTKMRNLKFDEEDAEPVDTPAIDKSGKRFTRSTIKSERKEPNQSAIKEQPIAEAQLFSPKVAKFKPDPIVNTAPGRITRTGIKHGVNAAGSFSEKVGTKKETLQSTHKKPLDDSQMASPKAVEAIGPNVDIGIIGDRFEVKQPLDEVQIASPEVSDTVGVRSEIFKEVTSQFGDLSASESVRPNIDAGIIGDRFEVKQSLDEVQISSPEVAEVQPIPDSDTVGIGSEMSKEVTSQIFGDLSASESVRLRTKTVEENRGPISGIGTEIESLSPVSRENASGEVMEDACACNEKSTCEAIATPCLTETGKQQNPSDLLSSHNVTPSGKNASHIEMTYVSMTDVAEAVPDADPDVSHVQNQNEEVYVESGVFTEAVNMETSALKSESLDATEKEIESAASGSTIWGLQTDVMIQGPWVSVAKTVVVEESVDISSLGADNSCDKHDVADDVEQYSEDESTSAQKSLMSEPDSADRGVADGVLIQENPFSGNDIHGECDNTICEQKFCVDMFGTPLIGKGDVHDDGINVLKELETSSELSNANKSLDVPVSGIDIDIERLLEDNDDVRDREFEHDQLTSNDNPARDEEDDIDIEHVLEDNNGVQDRESEHDQLTSNDNHAAGDDLEPCTQNENMLVVSEVLVRSHDQEPEQSLNVALDDVPVDMVGQSDSVMSKDASKVVATSGADDTVARADAPEELVVDMNKDVVSSILGDIYDLDAEGDSGNVQKSTEVDESFQPNDSGATFSDMSNEQTKEEADDQEHAALTGDNTDSVKFIEDGSHIGVNEAHYAEGDGGKKLTKVDESFQPNDSVAIFSDMSNEQTKEEAGDQEHAATTVDYADNAKLMEDGLHMGVNGADSELVGNVKAHEDPTREDASPILSTKGEPTVDGIASSQFMEDIGAHERHMTKESSPITYKDEESPVDDAGSDLPITKEDDRNNQDETRNAGTSVDWGDYDFEMDEFEEPVSANRSADVEGKDDEDTDLQTSARTSSSIEGSFGFAAGLTNSVRKLENDSRNAAEVKSNKDVDMLKGSANASPMAEEAFNWSAAGSSMKSLFTTPAASRISHLRDSQEDAAKFANQDTYSSLKSLFATAATTRTSHVTTGQEVAVDLPNQDHCSSLKPLSKTPAVSQIRHVKDSRDAKLVQDDAADFANQDHYSSLKPLFTTPAVSQISHVKDGRDAKIGQEDAAAFPNQDYYSSLKPLFKTSVAAQISHVKDGRDVNTGQDDSVDFANQDHYSSLKSLFKTPAVTQISHVKDGQKDAASYPNQDPYSSLKLLFTTPATTQISHVKGGREEATGFANKDHHADSSLKSLFSTPATSITSHISGHEADAVNFTFPDGRCNEDIGSSGTAAHGFNYQWGNDQSKDFNNNLFVGETQSNAVRGPENVMHVGPSFEDNFRKLFEKEVSGSIDKSGSNAHFEFKQSEFLNEEAATRHHNLSGLKDNSTHSHGFEKKEDTPMKGSEVNDDLAFDTGHAYDYRGNNQ